MSLRAFMLLVGIVVALITFYRGFHDAAIMIMLMYIASALTTRD